MLAPFPDSGRINISPSLAGELLRAAEGLPLYDNREFYSTDLQGMIMKGLLVLAQFHSFKDDSNRADYFVREYYLNPSARTGSFPSLFQTC